MDGKRILPLICIGPLAYYLDVVNEWIVGYKEPGMKVHFSQFRVHPSGYLIEGHMMESNASSYLIPPLVRIDPVGLAERYHKRPIYFMNMKHDREWLDDPFLESSLRKITSVGE